MKTAPLPTFTQEEDSQKLISLLKTKRIIVCYGAGGVGKTTSSAALGVRAALEGRRVLVLTIDPARRLADTLHISIEGGEPHHIDASRFEELGVSPTGSLDLWMVQPPIVFDKAIRGIVAPERAKEVFSLRIYQAMRRLISGMQEYMAGESLYQFYINGKYDLIILDTPPSRNAIDFLVAPDQLLGFLDSRILRVFAPTGKVSLFGRARRVLQSAFKHVGGSGFLGQVQTFTSLILDGIDTLKEHAETVQRVLLSGQTGHLLVTSAEPASLEEARFFQGVLEKMRMPVSGFLVNRTMAAHQGESISEYLQSHPLPEADDTPSLRAAIEAMKPFEEAERELSARHRALLESLRAGIPASALVLALPHLGRDIDDLQGLLQLARLLAP